MTEEEKIFQEFLKAQQEADEQMDKLYKQNL